MTALATFHHPFHDPASGFIPATGSESTLRQRSSWEENLVEKIWSRKQANYLKYVTSKNILHSNTDFSQVTKKEAYDAFETEWNCEDEIRLGENIVSVGDGPKFACGAELLSSTDECIVYSIGSAYDFSFEYSVHDNAPNCIIHTFDGTLNLTERALPEDLEQKNIYFHNWNVVSDCLTQHTGSVCVADSLKKLGHEQKTISWLKIDCESCEFTVIPEFLKSSVIIDQVMVEIHGTNAVAIHGLFQTFQDTGMVIFHKERNSWGCDGYRCVEYSLITLSYAKRVLQKYLSS